MPVCTDCAAFPRLNPEYHHSVIIKHNIIRWCASALADRDWTSWLLPRTPWIHFTCVIGPHVVIALGQKWLLDRNKQMSLAIVYKYTHTNSPPLISHPHQTSLSTSCFPPSVEEEEQKKKLKRTLLSFETNVHLHSALVISSTSWLMAPPVMKSRITQHIQYITTADENCGHAGLKRRQKNSRPYFSFLHSYEMTGRHAVFPALQGENDETPLLHPGWESQLFYGFVSPRFEVRKLRV